MKEKNKELKFKGKIIRCVYSSEDFKTYAVEVNKEDYPFIKFSKYGSATICGNLHELGIGQNYEIVAIEQNTKYGYSYKVINVRKDKPMSENDIYIFLQEILTFNQASQLWLHYPDIVDRVINGDIKDIDLSKLNGIGEKTFESIKTKIIENYALCDLVAEFNGVLTISMLKKLYDKYPSMQQLKNKLREDPYKCLCGLSHVGFITADSLLLELEKAEKIEFGYDLRTSKQRCLACVKYILEKNEENGNTRMDLRELRKQVMKQVPNCSSHFVDCLKEDTVYYNKDNFDVSLKSTYDIELYIANEIVDGLNRPRVWDFDWKKYKTQGEYELSDEQLELLHLACVHNIFMLEGAAGTGKSASTEMLIQMFKDNNITYKLMTPTGKSSKVLSDFTHEEATTIHRGLLYNPTTGWGYNKDNKLDIDVILVDEFSMVGLSLMKHLIDAIDFNRTKLILIGDPNQLPSVECANLMHDFLSSRIIPKATLSVVFRYGSNGLLTVATDIRQCKDYLTNNVGKITAIGDNNDYVFIKTPDELIVKESVALYKKLITTGYNGEIYNPSDIAVLTSYNKGDYGASALNKQLQKIANKNYGSSNKFNIGETVYYKDDITMEKINNYKAELFINDDWRYNEEDKENTTFIANGETGLVEEVSSQYIILNFDGVKVKYYRNDMNGVGLGYSYTFHKSQGSSIKAVIMITPKSHTYFLNSNLLYVGVTRSVDCCFHLGNVDTVLNAIHKKANLSRKTFMLEFLTKLKKGDING